MDYAIDIFRVPLIHLDVDNWKIKKKEIFKILKNKNLETSDFELVKSDFNKKRKEDFYNEKIQEIFLQEIKKLEIALGISNFKVTNSWFEKSEQNMYHQIHNHGALGFSSVCFIEYDQEEHLPTQFVSPFNNFLNGSLLSYSPENVKEGSILFFPSLIHHYTIPNNSLKERITLSFNLN